MCDPEMAQASTCAFGFFAMQAILMFSQSLQAQVKENCAVLNFILKNNEIQCLLIKYESGFQSGDWNGITFGINIGGGVGVNVGSANVTGSRTWLINDVKPTADRSFVDKATNLINPVLSAIVIGGINKIRNFIE